MSWASSYIEDLKAAKAVQFRPRGHSMTGRVNDGELVTVEPLTEYSDIDEGDIVLCSVKGNDYLHLIKSSRMERGKMKFLIGNNRGGINGWTSKIYGRVTRIEP